MQRPEFIPLRLLYITLVIILLPLTARSQRMDQYTNPVGELNVIA